MPKIYSIADTVTLSPAQQLEVAIKKGYSIMERTATLLADTADRVVKALINIDF
jgi:hypothetical protein